MILRTTKKQVTFKKPFVIGDFDEILPPGTYEVETDEELLEGLSFQAYRRVLTVIHLPGKSGRRGLSHTLAIDPSELDLALKRDEGTEAGSTKQVYGQGHLWESQPTHEVEADRQAEDRADDEGMGVKSS